MHKEKRFCKINGIVVAHSGREGFDFLWLRWRPCSQLFQLLSWWLFLLVGPWR